MQWEPALCLTLAWLMVYLCILRGTESTGKVGREHEGPRAWAGGHVGGHASVRQCQGLKHAGAECMDVVACKIHLLGDSKDDRRD